MRCLWLNCAAYGERRRVLRLGRETFLPRCGEEGNQVEFSSASLISRHSSLQSTPDSLPAVRVAAPADLGPHVQFVKGVFQRLGGWDREK